MPTVKTSKEEVIQKAFVVIRQRGYNNASMSDLAKACGIQPSHFYYYFKNKEDLMAEVLNFTVRYFKERIGVFADDESLAPSEKLEKILKKFHKILSFGEGGCIMGNTVLETAHTNPPFFSIIEQFFENYIATLTKIYKAKYTEDFARALAEQVVQDLQGGVLLSQLYNNDRFLQAAFQRALGHLK
jgi:TetR/AcrR family transcriptional regulator, transcriptional repressor for nem operon